MGRQPLFSTYRSGENRVTASMLAVFERVGVDVVERILVSATGESSLTLVNFQNQVSRGSSSVPDALISASFKLLFEVKTTRNAVLADQLYRHLDHFEHSQDQELLIVLTPDPEEPGVVSDVSDERIVWCSFRDISDAIDGLFDSPSEMLGERSEYLLRELQALFEEDGLLSRPEDTVIVAANSAYDEYHRYSAYICQPNRSFRRGIKYLGFYRERCIQPVIARILTDEDGSPLVAEELVIEDSATDSFSSLVSQLIDDEEKKGKAYKVFLLSSSTDPDTIILKDPIRNTKKSSKTGRPTAWTQSQRYVSSDILLSGITTTDELDALG